MPNQHLTNFTAELAGELTILVGDPARVKLFSELLHSVVEVTANREFIGVSGFYSGHRVSIMSTGIGIGSTEIAVIELIASGAKKLVRIGGCGAWQPYIKPGEIILNSAMARSSGMLSSYVPDSYPAVACPVLFHKIYSHLKKNSFIVHAGIGLTAEGFYSAQGRDISLFGQDDARSVIDFWSKRKILNAEMETAAIYILSSLYNIPAANCLVAHVSRENEHWLNEPDYHLLHKAAFTAVIESIVTV